MAHDIGEYCGLDNLGGGLVSAAWKRPVAAAGGVLQRLWRIRLGWLTGHAFLVVTHVGRRIGKRYRTVLYVQRYDAGTGEATVVSVWGESQWIRNISVAPAASVEIGLQRYTPRQRFLTTAQIVEVEKRFRARYRIIAWGQARLMGWPWPATDAQLHHLARRLRAVTFTPSDTSVQPSTTRPSEMPMRHDLPDPSPVTSHSEPVRHVALSPQCRSTALRGARTDTRSSKTLRGAQPSSDRPGDRISGWSGWVRPDE